MRVSARARRRLLRCTPRDGVARRPRPPARRRRGARHRAPSGAGRAGAAGGGAIGRPVKTTSSGRSSPAPRGRPSRGRRATRARRPAAPSPRGRGGRCRRGRPRPPLQGLLLGLKLAQARQARRRQDRVGRDRQSRTTAQTARTAPGRTFIISAPPTSERHRSLGHATSRRSRTQEMRSPRPPSRRAGMIADRVGSRRSRRSDDRDSGFVVREGQQADGARALDRLRDLALVLRRQARAATRQDLALGREEAAHQILVLVSESRCPCSAGSNPAADDVRRHRGLRRRPCHHGHRGHHGRHESPPRSPPRPPSQSLDVEVIARSPVPKKGSGRVAAWRRCGKPSPGTLD